MLEKMGITHWPKRKVDFKRVIAEGDLVMTQVVQPKTDATPETVIVDWADEGERETPYADISHARALFAHRLIAVVRRARRCKRGDPTTRS